MLTFLRSDSRADCQVHYSGEVRPSIMPLKSRFRLVDVMDGSTFRTALVLPSIMKRIEDFLVVQELNTKFFNHAVHEDLLFAAISTPSAGYEVDYERLELFGLSPRCKSAYCSTDSGPAKATHS